MQFFFGFFVFLAYVLCYMCYPVCVYFLCMFCVTLFFSVLAIRDWLVRASLKCVEWDIKPYLIQCGLYDAFIVCYLQCILEGAWEVWDAAGGRWALLCNMGECEWLLIWRELIQKSIWTRDNRGILGNFLPRELVSGCRKDEVYLISHSVDKSPDANQ